MRATPRFVLTVTLLAIAVVLPAQEGWTVYLQGEQREAARTAVRTLDAYRLRAEVIRRRVYASIQERYVAARDEERSADDYADTLVALGLPAREELLARREAADAGDAGTAAAGEAAGAAGGEAAAGAAGTDEPGSRSSAPAGRVLRPEVLAALDSAMVTVGLPPEVAAARATVAGVLEDALPLPGSRSFAEAGAWLGALAAQEGLPVERLRELVAGAGAALVNALGDRELERLIRALPVADDPLPPELSQADRAEQLLLMWELQILGARDPARVRQLSRISELVRGLRAGESETVVNELADGLAGIASGRRDALRLRASLELSAEGYAMLRPRVFTAPAGPHAREPALQELLEVLSALAAADELHAAVLRNQAPLVAFLIDTSEALLGSLSPLQSYELARAGGLSARELSRIRTALHRIRVTAADRGSPADGTESTAGGDESLARFLEEGTDYLSAAEPWAAGERSRSGDSYRWAMLPIVSHPYAQYLLATLPEYAEMRTMVAGFVSQVYEEALRRPELQGARITPVVIGDAAQPFLRVYRVPDRRTATALYQAFAAVAQGQDQLADDFTAPYAAGLSVAGYWSHMHGLHVVVGEEPDTAEVIRRRVDEWIGLARAANTEEEELALTQRALLSLRRVLTDELQPITGSSGVVNIRVYEPRLPLVRARLDESVTFRTDPRLVLRELARLYDAPPGEATIGSIASDAGRLLTRLGRVEIPDRRLIEARAAAGEDRE